ncbi:MAG: MerR family transcriptional regulator [Eubacteriaceae bacterium]
MKFKVSNIEKCFGMSPNGIRLYEKYGIIKPKREINSNYRVFGREESFSLSRGMQYRNLGFTMKETADILTRDLKEQLFSLKKRNSTLIDEIKYMQYLQNFQQRQIQRISNITEKYNVCEIIDVSEMYFVKSYEIKEDRINEKNIPIIRNWTQKYVPFAAPAFMYLKKLFEKSQYDMNMIVYGAVIEKEYAEFFDIPINENISIFPSGTCLQTIVKYSVSDYYELENLSHVVDYIRTNGLKISGDACSRFIIGEKVNKNYYRYDMLWVPVQLK